MKYGEPEWQSRCASQRSYVVSRKIAISIPEPRVVLPTEGLRHLVRLYRDWCRPVALTDSSDRCPTDLVPPHGGGGCRERGLPPAWGQCQCGSKYACRWFSSAWTPLPLQKPENSGSQISRPHARLAERRTRGGAGAADSACSDGKGTPNAMTPQLRQASSKRVGCSSLRAGKVVGRWGHSAQGSFHSHFAKYFTALS